MKNGIGTHEGGRVGGRGGKEGKKKRSTMYCSRVTRTSDVRTCRCACT